jgi:hypothetical protein
MSETLNAAILKSEFADTAISETNAEVVLMGSIRLLNTFGASLTQMTGTAGSRTGTYTYAQIGAIMALAQQIYAKHYKNASGTTNSSIGQISVSAAVDAAVLEYAKILARALKTTSGTPPIYVANESLPSQSY